MNNKTKFISKKFIMLSTIAVLLIAILTGGISTFLINKSLTRHGENEIGLLCEKESSELDALFQRIEQSVLILAQSAIDDLGSYQTLVDEELVDEYISNMRQQILTASGYTDGCIAAYIRIDPAFADTGAFMQRRSLGDQMEQLVLTDLSLYSPDDREHVGWFYEPLRKGYAIWLDPYYNKNIDIYMISYVVPLKLDGVTIGVLGMDIDFDYVTEFVDQINPYESGRAFLLSEDNHVVWHDEYGYGSEFEYSEGMIYESIVLENGMKLVLEVPQSEVYAERNHQVLYVLGITVAVLILSLVMVNKICSSIVRPLNELTDKAKSLNAGNMDIDFNVESDDEVGILASTLHETVLRLKHYIDVTNGLAYVDSLTGIKNKTAYDSFVENLNKDISLKTAEPFGVVMCDLNGLKEINDNFGHEFGNLLIINGCKFICRTFSHSPVFRIGGDEFTVILKGSDYERRTEILNSLDNAMLQTRESKYKYEHISIAYGMSEYDRSIDSSVDAVFARADMNMYEKKRQMKADQ